MCIGLFPLNWATLAPEVWNLVSTAEHMYTISAYWSPTSAAHYCRILLAEPNVFHWGCSDLITIFLIIWTFSCQKILSMSTVKLSFYVDDVLLCSESTSRDPPFSLFDFVFFQEPLRRRVCWVNPPYPSIWTPFPAALCENVRASLRRRWDYHY